MQSPLPIALLLSGLALLPGTSRAEAAAEPSPQDQESGRQAGPAGGVFSDWLSGGDWSRIRTGFQIAPVSLNLRGKNPAWVGLGSYIVNAQGGCNDCHTAPPYQAGGNPYQRQATVINVNHYLAGGMSFGPGLTSPNLTPDHYGLPAGLTYEAFRHALRTGQDPDGSERILQVMPWPVYGQMTDQDLRAIYEYLRAIPHAEPETTGSTP